MNPAHFLQDAYATTLQAQVMACVPDGDGFAVALSDTVLYPEGGGQPSDSGQVGKQPVSAVFWRDGQVWHRLASPLEAGCAVTVTLDWPRRYDHMQQHTAQHLLTAVLADGWALHTTAFHLGETQCDIEVAAPKVDPALLRQAEDRVNGTIRQALPVTQRWVQAEDLAGLTVRSRGLPDGFSGPVRLVEMAGIDLNTCGGTHLASTAEVGSLVILGTEHLKRGTRIHWLAGDRVRRQLALAESRTNVLNGLLACGPELHAEAISRTQQEAHDASRAQRALLGELAGWIGRDLAKQPGPVLLYHRNDGDLAFLGTVARAVLAVQPDRLLIFTCGDPQGAGMFLLAGAEEPVAQVGPELAALLEGRGGGARGRYQGKAARLDLLADAGPWLIARTKRWWP